VATLKSLGTGRTVISSALGATTPTAAVFNDTLNTRTTFGIIGNGGSSQTMLQFGYGLVTAPTNTGSIFVSASDFILSTAGSLSFGLAGGAEWARFATSTGNLLIGTTTDISGTGGLRTAGVVSAAGGVTAATQIQATAGAALNLQNSASDAQANILNIGGSGASIIDFRTASTSRLTIGAAGPVGITSTATATASSAGGGALQVGSNVGLSGNAGGASYFGGAATFAGAVTTGGAVAIAAPSSQTGLSIDGVTYPEFAFRTSGVKKAYATYITANGGIFPGSLIGDLTFRNDSGQGFIFGTSGAAALLTVRDSGATFAGAVSLSTAGTTVSIKSGTNAAAGTVTLSGGAGTITSTAIDVNTVIVMSIKTKTGSFDHAPSVLVAAGSATIDGHNSDDSTYNWVALKVN
jgi:hypothetical protein